MSLFIVPVLQSRSPSPIEIEISQRRKQGFMIDLNTDLAAKLKAALVPEPLSLCEAKAWVGVLEEGWVIIDWRSKGVKKIYKGLTLEKVRQVAARLYPDHNPWQNAAANDARRAFNAERGAYLYKNCAIEEYWPMAWMPTDSSAKLTGVFEKPGTYQDDVASHLDFLRQNHGSIVEHFDRIFELSRRTGRPFRKEDCTVDPFGYGHASALIWTPTIETASSATTSPA